MGSAQLLDALGLGQVADRADELDQIWAGLLGAAGVERRLRVVLDAELHRLRDLVAGQDGGQAQRQVDAGRHPGAGQVLAVGDDALGGVGRTEAFEQVAVMPVGGGGSSVEQPGGMKIACRDEIYC